MYVTNTQPGLEKVNDLAQMLQTVKTFPKRHMHWLTFSVARQEAKRDEDAIDAGEFTEWYELLPSTRHMIYSHHCQCVLLR